MRKRLKRPAAPSPVVWGLSWAVTMVTCSSRVRVRVRIWTRVRACTLNQGVRSPGHQDPAAAAAPEQSTLLHTSVDWIG